MKKFSQTFIIAILLGSFVFPFLTSVVVAQDDDEIRRFRIGLTGTPAVDWDRAITSAYGIIDLWYKGAALEYMYGTNRNYDRGFSSGVPKQDTYIPILATSWVFDYWPEEINSKGFINKGGAENITFRLREGVTFHDGSAWNATVAKWNIDRVWIITGNLTGRGDLRNRDIYWYPVANYADYYTESWNLTSLIDPYPFGVYDGYFNPRPSDGGAGVDAIWGTADDDFVAHTPYNLYPIVKRVVITDDQASGGEIRIEFNDWNMYGMTSVGLIRFMSMETYADFWDTGIYGFDNDDPLYPDHMIGTGPYMYVDHDETAEPGGGSMQKNPNYWNRTALEAAGWYDADFIDIITWPAGTLGIESRNTALMTNAIDFALDNFFTPVDYDDVMSNNQIRYMEEKPSDYITAITLNCIDETWWDQSWGVINWSTTYLSGYPSGNTPDGVPRALRKAMSYAFNYDQYINVGLNGRAVRASALGVTNIYYDDTVPIATHDLTIARETLLNDPIFGPITAAQGLTASSTDSDWQDVANSVGGKTPIWSLEFYWDDNFETLKNVFQTSLEDIGVTLADETGALGYKVPTTIWTEAQIYWLNGFPVFSADAWPLDWNIPEVISEGWIDAYYADPDDGRWRPPNYDFSDSIFWPDFNLAFTYATETDAWVHEMYLTNDTARGTVMNKIANWSQNYQYPWIFVSQSKEGYVIWKDWEMSDYWGVLSYTLLKYTGFPAAPIPGFEIGITLTVSAVSVVSVVYVIMRKKKIH